MDLRVGYEIHRAIKRAATSDDLNVSEVVREAIGRHLAAGRSLDQYEGGGAAAVARMCPADGLHPIRPQVADCGSAHAVNVQVSAMAATDCSARYGSEG